MAGAGVYGDPDGVAERDRRGFLGGAGRQYGVEPLLKGAHVILAVRDEGKGRPRAHRSNAVFGRQLHQRPTAAGSPVRSLLAHPGHTSTELTSVRFGFPAA